MRFLIILIIISSVILTSCSKTKIGEIKNGNKPIVTSVNIQYNKMTLTGVGLQGIKSLKLLKNGVEHSLNILTKSSDSIMINADSAISLKPSDLLSLVIESAYASEPLTVSFTIANNTIENAMIKDGVITSSKLSGSGFSAGNVLSWNGSAWVGTTLSGLSYSGTWNANTNTPDLTSLTPADGTFYIISNSGTTSLSGVTTWNTGDWAIYNSGTWERVPTSSGVTSVFGRSGSITAQSGDYTWAQINKTTSSIGDIADVDLSTPPSNNQVLKFNGTKWIPSADLTGGGGGGSVSSSDDVPEGSSNLYFTNARAQSALSGLLSNKEGTITAGTTGQYYRGDKTWQTLDKSAVGLTNVPNTDATARSNHTGTQTASTISDFASTVLSTALTGLSTATNTVVSATDTILEAIGKLQAQNTAQDTSISGHSTSLSTDASNIFQLQTDVSNLTTALSAKEASLASGTTSQYYRGDKTWQTLNTTAVTEGTNQYFTNARVLSAPLTGLSTTNSAILDTDTILQGFNKAQGQINSLSSTVSTNSGDILSLQNTASTLTTAVASKEPSITAGTTAQYYRGDKSWQTLDKTAVGLSNVPNTDATARSNHTGTQTASTISDFETATRATVLTGIAATGSSNVVISAADSVLLALGKLQREINYLLDSTKTIVFSKTEATLGALSNMYTARAPNNSAIVNIGYDTTKFFLPTGSAGVQVVTDGSVTSMNSSLFLDVYDDSSTYSELGMRRSRGSLLTASRTAVQSGDVLGRISGYAFSGTSFPASPNAKIEMLASENQTASARGSSIGLSITKDAGQTSYEALKILGLSTNTNNTSVQIAGNASGTYGMPSGDMKASLDISGSAITRPKTYAGGTTFDMSLSNAIIVTSPTGSAFTLNNLQDGGSYTLNFQDSASTITPSFTMYKAEDGSQISGGNIKFSPSLTARTSGKHWVASLVRMGSYVYINWQEF